MTDAKNSFFKVFQEATNKSQFESSEVKGEEYKIRDGSVLIAAITSCTNTSNPNVLIGAGLLAKKAVEFGLDVKPWVKTSLAPGSQVVTDYLEKAGLNIYLDFGTEAGLFQEIGISTVVCGPGSIEQAHKIDEYIVLDELKKCLKLLEGIKEKSALN